MADTITRADVAQVATTNFTALYRAAKADGSATVLVADRKVNHSEADVRVRADKVITVRRAANSLAHRWGWTRDEVLAHFGVTDSKQDVARAGLRNAYIAEQGVVRVG